MAFENAMLFDQLAKVALKKYGWDKSEEAKRIVLSENATYVIKNKVSGEKKGVLRISRPGYHTIDELNAEMKWLEQINRDTHIEVANPIPGSNGEKVQIIQDGYGRQYQCVVCEFLSGNQPKETNEELMVKQFRMLGKTTACLHRQTQMWGGTRNLHRIEWTYETIIGKEAVWGRWENFPGITEEAEEKLREVCRIIKCRLLRYGKNKNNYGLIHGDLRLANLLLEGEKIKVIDFDDCGFGWHLQDLASALSFIEEKPVVPRLVTAWLKGYEQVLPISKADLEEIDTFIMLRRLQLTAWLASHQESEPAEELGRNWIKGTMKLAHSYLQKFAFTAQT